MRLIPQTNQEAFDMAVLRLTDGTGRAVEYANYVDSSEGEACTYHSVSGHRCVVGAMLTPEDALKAQKDLLCVTDIVGKESPLDEELLAALQGVHDDADHWDDNVFNANGWRELQIIALDHNLRDARHHVGVPA